MTKSVYQVADNGALKTKLGANPVPSSALTPDLVAALNQYFPQPEQQQPVRSGGTAGQSLKIPQ